MTDTDETAVWDGTYWEGLNRSRDRNVIINGAMQVAQRGTSTASITSGGYYTADRWVFIPINQGTWTNSIEADAPTGSGLRNSFKVLCTTADAAPAASDVLAVANRLEGQNVQQFLKGTASAKQFALSFWVKSNVTGTYIVNLIDQDNTRVVAASYSVSASATWEKKTIILPADTTGVLDNDNARSLDVQFYLGAGTDSTSGTLQTTWASTVTANRAVGQTNLAAATSNYWQVTGVQLEAGAVATPFEFEYYETTLAKCQRYYYLLVSGINKTFSMAAAYNTAFVMGYASFPVTMRTTPSLVATSGTNYYNFARRGASDQFNSITIATPHPTGARMDNYTEISSTLGDAGILETTNAAASIAFSAEL